MARQVIALLAHLAGMPIKILRAYYNFLQSLLYMTKLSCGYGKPTARLRSFRRAAF